MKKSLADGVIVVHCGRREMLLGFIERDEEYIQISLPEIQDSLAFAGNADPGWRPMPEPGKIWSRE